jgi:hypothetical protein
VTTGIRTFPDRHDRLLPSCQAQPWLKSGEKWARSAHEPQAIYSLLLGRFWLICLVDMFSHKRE